MIKGRRVYPDSNGRIMWSPGDYGLEIGVWYGRIPSEFGDFNLGSFQQHQVVEHEDGTITVSPSILHTQYIGETKKHWHGWLQKGIWKI